MVTVTSGMLRGSPGGGKETVGCRVPQTWLRYSDGVQELPWPDLRSDVTKSDAWFRLGTCWPSLGASGVAKKFQTENSGNLAKPTRPSPSIITTRPPAHPKATEGNVLAGEFGREFGGNSGGIRPRFRGIRPRHCLRIPTGRCAGASNELHRVVLL